MKLSKLNMKFFKKRQVTIVALVLLVGIAGYLNWSFNVKNTPQDDSIATMSGSEAEQAKKYGEATLVSTQPTEESDYFTEARLSKEKARSESVELLKGTASDQNASQEAKDKANAEILTITKNIEQENVIENLILAKDIGKSIVFINATGVNVVVDNADLQAADAAKIQDIVVSQTGVSPDQVKVMGTKK